MPVEYTGFLLSPVGFFDRNPALDVAAEHEHRELPRGEERVMTGLTELDGRAAVVTGAASGIGLAVTEAFVAAGMKVLMTDRDEEALASHAERLAEGGAEVRALTVDVTDPDSVERAAVHAVEQFGKLHVAVNNAGIVAGGNSWELPLSEWHRVIDVDLWGVIHGIHSFVPRILASGEPGYVVNTASMAAVTAIPGIGPYTASKHAVLGISDGLRGEFESDRRTGRGLRRDARDDQDRHEPVRDGGGRTGRGQRARRACAAVARTCSPTITTSPRSSRASTRSWPRGRTWCRRTWTAGTRRWHGAKPSRATSRSSWPSSSSRSSTATSSGASTRMATSVARVSSAGRWRRRPPRAASLTVPDDRSIHSLHGYFLRAGEADRPTILHVDRDRDGRSFSARHVAARQDGKVIMSLLVSFHVDEEGPEYQATGLPAGRATARGGRPSRGMVSPPVGARSAHHGHGATTSASGEDRRTSSGHALAAPSPTTASCTRACSRTSPTSGPGSRS